MEGVNDMYTLRFEPPMDPPEPDVAFHCDCCGEEIYVGEDYYEIEDVRICKECLIEWMDKYYKKEAEAEEYEPDPDRAYDEWRDKQMDNYYY